MLRYRQPDARGRVNVATLNGALGKYVPQGQTVKEKGRDTIPALRLTAISIRFLFHNLARRQRLNASRGLRSAIVALRAG